MKIVHMTALAAATQKRLLAAVKSAPDDDQPRLAYAEFLEDFEPEQAAFIRAHLAVPGMDTGHHTANRPTWVFPSFSVKKHGHLCRFTWRRGFIDEVSCHLSWWMPFGGRLLTFQPVAKVVLHGETPQTRKAVVARWHKVIRGKGDSAPTIDMLRVLYPGVELQLLK